MEKGEQSRTTEQLQGSNAADIAHAAEILQRGGLVAMPTETVYGLAADALDAAAVERIFEAKQRPHWDPLIVHIAGSVTVDHVASHIPPAARLLMDALWPGPLTLLLPRQPNIPAAVTAGRHLVGVRMPAHPVAQALIHAAGVPLAAPSANRFGHISPTTAAHVLADLEGRINAVLDAGPCSVGVESTVFDPSARVIYRQGGVSHQQLEHLLGEPVTVHEPHDATTEHPESLPSPGVGIRHYAPRAKVLLVEDESAMRASLAEFGMFDAGVMLPQGWAVPGFRGAVFAWERLDNPAALARTLYTGLRELDVRGVEAIVCPLPPSSHEPLVEAIRDRLTKAAKAH